MEPNSLANESLKPSLWEKGFAVGEVIKYKDEFYRVEKVPTNNEGKYRIVGESSNQVYTPTAEQLKILLDEEEKRPKPKSKSLTPPMITVEDIRALEERRARELEYLKSVYKTSDAE